MTFVYHVENKVSGGSYIGITDDPETRQKDHFRNSCNPHLRNAIAKYGREWFTFEIIEHYSTPEEAEQSEIFWIANLRSIGANVYNMNDGGERVVWTDEMRSQVAERNRNRVVSEETKEKHRQAWTGEKNPNFGKPMTDDAKAKMRAKKLGKEPWNKGISYGSGADNPNAKLTREQAEVIRAEYPTIKSARKLAAKYGVSKPTILSIVNGKRYA